ANAAATGGKDLNNFALVAGVSAKEFQTKFKQDASGAIIDFVEGLGRMSTAGENTFAVLDALGLSEIRVRDALLRASGAGDVLRESLDLGAKSWAENTALTNEAETRYATTASQLEIMKNKIMDAAITLGDSLKPALLAVMTALEPIILKMTEFANMFAQLDQSTQTTIIVIAAVVAALGPVLLIVGQLSMSIAALIPVVQALGTALTFLATNPWGLAITAVVSTLAIMTTGILSAKAATEELTAAQVALQEVQQNGIDRADIAATEERITKINELTASYEELIKAASESNAGQRGQTMKALTQAADELGISMSDLRKRAREFGVELEYVDDKGKLSAKSMKDLKAASDTYSTAVKNAQKATASEINEMARGVAARQQQINSTLNMIKVYNTAKQGTQEWQNAQKSLIDQFPQFSTATGVNTEAVKGLILVKQREVELEWQSIQVKAAEAHQEKITAIAKQEAAITIVNGINKIAGASGIAEGALNKMNAELTRLRGEAASLQALLDMKP
ncbi:phage tail tape measure protein, partial [Bacillus altitudinis]|uniref:phage tail tape measure protein n=1 Tax=Bacillus altitudinis TaxID=293387 RepID=UPI0036703284